jgi:3'-5' exoribonuclease
MSKKEEDFIENLNLSRDISSEFVIAEKIIRTSAKGRKYIDITLVDRTGQMDGRMFPNPIEVDSVHASINLGSVCRIMGRISEFPIDSGKFNMVINMLTELEDDEYELEDFVMASENNTDELVDEIRRTIKDMENPQLKNLLKSFFCDKNFTELFYKAPAAIVHHHNYMGGLLDHTVEVLRISRTACNIFPNLKKDLLYCGVLLHDIGKIKTYTFGNGPISISDEGELLDHIYISCEMVKEKMEKLDTPKDLSNQILHMILSHHGPVSLGWGSSIDPKTPEAKTLHYSDDMDAKIKETFQR